MNNLIDFNQFFVKNSDRLEQAQEEKTKLSETSDNISSHLQDLHEARSIVNSVGILAQDGVKDVIEDLVTKALRTVFGEDYSFVIKNEVVRNKPETFLYIKVNEDEFLTKDDLEGGGALDIVSFVLRVVLWAFEENRTRNTIVLDEPGKNISKDNGS